MHDDRLDAALRERLASARTSVRAGATWELLLERRLRAAGLEVVRHAPVPGIEARPDLAVDAAGGTTYVEATATGGGDPDHGRQATRDERLHDVLMSRLKRKSRALQGIEAPLVVAVLCIAPHCSRMVVEGAVDELFDPGNDAGRNVSAVLAGWQLDGDLHPRRLLLRRHPTARIPLGARVERALGG